MYKAYHIFCDARQVLNTAGIVLKVSGDKLLSRKMDGAATPPEMRELIRENKSTLMHELTVPRLDRSGNLIIPFGSPLKYQWWRKGGQPSKKTLEELQPNS